MRRSRVTRPSRTGRPLEAAGNDGPRWMVAPLHQQRTKPGLQADSPAAPHQTLVFKLPGQLEIATPFSERTDTLFWQGLFNHGCGSEGG